MGLRDHLKSAISGERPTEPSKETTGTPNAYNIPDNSNASAKAPKSVGDADAKSPAKSTGGAQAADTATDPVIADMEEGSATDTEELDDEASRQKCPRADVSSPRTCF